MEPTAWSTTMDALTATFNEEHPLETETIHLGNRSLDVAVARTPGQWATGLVGHADIDAMLFVMPPGSQFPFHMRNIDRDLVIAFFDEQGNLVDYAFLEAQVGIKWPVGPYTYVLELAEPIDISLFDEFDRGLRLE